jgi:YfiH family protein
MMPIDDLKPNDGFVWVQEPWGRALRCVKLTAPHLFTSRDVTLRTDEGEWRLVAASLGVERDRLLLIRQVHGTSVAIARRGRASQWVTPEADILLSDDPTVAIGVRVADCAPVLLVDDVTKAVGVVHAGWRGTALDAAGAAVRAMRDAFGSDPRDLVAAVGPCLGECCGEVGREVMDAFRAGGASDASLRAWFHPASGDRAYVNLERANLDQLASAGVRATNVHVAGLCTKTHRDRFHSYRADRAAAGRMLGAIRSPVR